MTSPETRNPHPKCHLAKQDPVFLFWFCIRSQSLSYSTIYIPHINLEPFTRETLEWLRLEQVHLEVFHMEWFHSPYQRFVLIADICIKRKMQNTGDTQN